MRKEVELLFEEHYSLQFCTTWDLFRARQTDNKLYVLHSPIIEKGKIIGFKAWEKRK